MCESRTATSSGPRFRLGKPSFQAAIFARPLGAVGFNPGQVGGWKAVSVPLAAVSAPETKSKLSVKLARAVRAERIPPGPLGTRAKVTSTRSDGTSSLVRYASPVETYVVPVESP